MAEPFLGEIRIMSFNFPPKGWAFCNGQFLPINQNQALFALFGTQFGGNGQTTFALPDLRGRVPIHQGNGHVVGGQGGEAAHTLSAGALPTHTHALTAAAGSGTTPIATSNMLAAAQGSLYAPPSSDLTTLFPTSLNNVGGSQAHENHMPSLTLNFSVALQGIFPSQN